jgi:hypothetical protein
VPKPKKVKFKAGQVQRAVNVTISPDLLGEPDESVNASIDTSPLPVLSNLGSADVLMLNDDDTASTEV